MPTPEPSALTRSVGLEMSFSLMAVSLTVILIAMLIPISIGGLGVREGVLRLEG